MTPFGADVTGLFKISFESISLHQIVSPKPLLTLFKALYAENGRMVVVKKEIAKERKVGHENDHRLPCLVIPCFRPKHSDVSP